MSNKSKDPCKKYACNIQTCLKENQYQEDKCFEALEAMRLCCIKWQKESFVCGGIDLNRSYLLSTTVSAADSKKEKLKK